MKDLEQRISRLRDGWPVGSMVDDVMARIEPAPRRVHPRWLSGLAASGLLVAMGLAGALVLSRPEPLSASVVRSVEKAASVHLTMTVEVPNGPPRKGELWYRRDEGMRLELDERVIVEDGKTQWSWRPVPAGAELRVMRRKSPGFLDGALREMLRTAEIPEDWTRTRAPELDLVSKGRALSAYRLEPRAENLKNHRAEILADSGGAIHEIRIESKTEGNRWKRERLIQIEYDVAVPPEKIAAKIPDGAKIVDVDQAFESLYPMDRALARAVKGGLQFAVHDVRPLKDREGFYVVSSVRGTPEFLKAHPPRRRPINPEVVLLDVAFPPPSNQMFGGKYDLIVMGHASREGVEYSWWLVVPRRYYQMKDGRREYLPDNPNSFMPGEPGALDDLAGKARVPLTATYWSPDMRDERGVQRSETTWAEVPLPADHAPTTLEDAAARTRRDLVVITQGAGGGLIGLAPGSKASPGKLSPLASFAPDSISEADFGAAVRRGLTELRDCDEVRPIQAEEMLPPLKGEAPKS